MNERYAIRVYKQCFNFSSSHFLVFADGSREPLHGHNYRVEVRVEGAVVEGDIVVDFIRFKPLVRAICDDLDHVLLLPESSPHLELGRRDGQLEIRPRDGSFFSIPAQDARVLPMPNTSTEMLARHIARRLAVELPEQIPSVRLRALEVQVEETAGQSGVCRLELEGG